MVCPVTAHNGEHATRHSPLVGDREVQVIPKEEVVEEEEEEEETETS